MNNYTNLARKTIEEFVKNGKVINPPKGLPDELLKKRAGVFVSIHKHQLSRTNDKSRIDTDGELRGCIGTILPTKENVAQEIIDNATSACSKDYRFSPITKDELDELNISVDVLNEPEPIPSDLRLAVSHLNPKKYGVIVKSENGKTGLLLPNLPGINDPEYQIAIARQKASIQPNETIYLYRFEVTRHKES